MGNKNTQDWHDKFTASNGSLFNIAIELSSIANAFAETGNKTMADRLFEISEAIHGVQKLNSDAIGQSICEAVNRSGDMSASILNAALAGIDMAQNNQ